MLKHTTILFAALLLASCALPTEPSDACADEAAFCAAKQLAPLSADETRAWQDRANDYADAQYGVGRRAYPEVTWRACFFAVGHVCAAGWTESAGRIHVSTAEPWRTGPLVAHETLHSVYALRFGDFDAGHTRPYAW